MAAMVATPSARPTGSQGSLPGEVARQQAAVARGGEEVEVHRGHGHDPAACADGLPEHLLGQGLPPEQAPIGRRQEEPDGPPRLGLGGAGHGDDALPGRDPPPAQVLPGGLAPEERAVAGGREEPALAGGHGHDARRVPHALPAVVGVSLREPGEHVAGDALDNRRSRRGLAAPAPR